MNYIKAYIIGCISQLFFVSLITGAILFRGETKINCSSYEYRVIDTSNIIIVIPIPLDSCIGYIKQIH